MPGAFTICTAMFANGALIGMVVLLVMLLRILPGLRPARGELIEADVGDPAEPKDVVPLCGLVINQKKSILSMASV